MDRTLRQGGRQPSIAQNQFVRSRQMLHNGLDAAHGAGVARKPRNRQIQILLGIFIKQLIDIAG
jgi:hypothetical protein